MKQLRYLSFILAAMVLVASCKKQLDLQPTDTFSDDNAFITLEDVQQGVNGAFARYGTYANDMYTNALLSDEAKLGLDNAGQGAITYRWNFGADLTTGSDVIAAWGGYYALIDQVNRVLPFVSTVSAPSNQEYRRNILRAHLLALRGVAHFGLLQAYSKVYNPSDPLGVPIMLTSNVLAKPARSSMGAVMDQIIADLDQAKNLLPAVTPADFKDTVFNRVNIAAYQARIALYRRDYDAAITYATEVINSGVKPLVSGSAFSAIWIDQSEAEVLFRVRYATSAAIGSMWTTLNGQVYIAPSDKLRISYSANDIRLSTYIGDFGGGNYYVNKFFTSARGGRVVDIKAARTSEMYLIRAEANARKTSPNIAAGAADLNFLRSMRITGYVDQTFSTAEELANAVMLERFKELAFEGFRFYDLKRNGLPVERLASDASPTWQTLPATSYRFVMPIPSTEIQANPNMVQNDEY